MDEKTFKSLFLCEYEPDPWTKWSTYHLELVVSTGAPFWSSEDKKRAKKILRDRRVYGG
jgi:hypothetical protein